MEDLYQLADEVEHYDVETADRVRKVAADAGTPRAVRWFGVDMAAALGLDTLERKIISTRNRFINYLEYGRNVLVVVPLLLTWFFLSLIAVNYTFAVQNQHDLRFDTFLLLGRQAFIGPLPLPVFTLSHIAVFDTVLLIIIVVLTGVINLRSDIVEKEARNQAIDIRHKLEAALWQVPDSAPGGGETDVVQLISYAQSLLNQQENATKLLESLQQIYVELKSSISQLNTAATTLKVSLSGVEGGLKQIDQGFTTASTKLEQAVANAEQKNQQAFTQLNSAAGSLTQGVNSLVQNLGGVQAAVQSVQNALQGSVGSLPQVASSLDMITQKQNEATNLLQHTFKQIDGYMQGFNAMQDVYRNSAIQTQKDLGQLIQDLRSSLRPESNSLSGWILLVQVLQLIIIIGGLVFILIFR